MNHNINDQELIAEYLSRNKPTILPSQRELYAPYDGRLEPIPTTHTPGEYRSKQILGQSLDENNRFYGN